MLAPPMSPRSRYPDWSDHLRVAGAFVVGAVAVAVLAVAWGMLVGLAAYGFCLTSPVGC